MEPVEGKCTFKLPMKPRLCYQMVNPIDSIKFCRFHLDQEITEANKRQKIEPDGTVILGKDL
jgi:hypothetical protein